MYAHEQMKTVLHAAGDAAGLLHPNEPTHAELLDRFPDHLPCLFPRNSSPKVVDGCCDLITKLFAIERMPSLRGPARDATFGEFQQNL